MEVTAEVKGQIGSAALETKAILSDKQIAQDTLEDSGYKSRKYWALFAFWGLCLLGFCIQTKWPAGQAQYPLFVGGLSTGLAAYYGVNFGHAFLANKTNPADAEEKK